MKYITIYSSYASRFLIPAFIICLIVGLSNPLEVAAQAVTESEMSEMDMGSEPSHDLLIQEESAAPLGQQLCTAPPSGMTGWWHLDESSGTTVSDIAGYANNGSRRNNPTSVTGKVSRALSFNGYNNYVEVRDHHDLDVGRGDFSIDAWVKTTDRNGVKVLVDKRYENRSRDTQGYSLFLNNGQLAFQLADGNGSWYCSSSSSSSCSNFTSGVSVADGRWHLVAVTVDRNSSNGGRFYVDGRLVRTFNPTGRQGSLDNNKPLRIGSRSSYTTGLFRGEIDEVELFKRVLSSWEISKIYHAGSAGKCKRPDSPSQPDLTPLSASFNNACHATVTYKNIGNAPITGYSYMKGETPSGGNIGAGWTLYPTLNAGGTGTRTWNPGGGRYGSQLRITVDSNSQVSESNESNNVKYFPVPARCQGTSQPDLVPLSVSFDNTCHATVTYKNIGNAPMTGYSYMKGETPSGGNIGVGWTLYPTLNANSTGTRTWNPGGGRYGSVLRITVDSNSQVNESNESNNVKNFAVPPQCIGTNPPTPTPTLTPTPTPTPSGSHLYFSSSSSGYVNGVSFRDEDILALNPSNNRWSMYFDGSDVGLSYKDINAFHIQQDGNILFSLDSPQTLGGVYYDDSDVIKFTASSLGNRTRGSFSMFFDGSDVGLTSSSEDIDAIALLYNGDMVLSTIGTAYVSGATARDEDMLRFRKMQYGNNTRGSWSLYLDGSDIGLTTYAEDIWAAGVASDNQIQLSTYGNYNVSSSGTSLQGDSDDIIRCRGTLGNNTSCRLDLGWNGDNRGFGNEQVDGYSVGPAPRTVVFSAVADENDAAEEEPSEAEDDKVDDMLDDDEYTERLYLPLINR